MSSTGKSVSVSVSISIRSFVRAGEAKLCEGVSVPAQRWAWGAQTFLRRARRVPRLVWHRFLATVFECFLLLRELLLAVCISGVH